MKAPFNSRQPRSFDTLFRPGDDARMTEAVRYLLRNNRLPIRRPAPYQLKVGTLNFYPTSGKITVDQGAEGRSVRCLPERGLAAFAHALGWPTPDSPEDGTWGRERAARQASNTVAGGQAASMPTGPDCRPHN